MRPVVRTVRRALITLVVAALIAGFVRLRGTGGTPPRRGGWRELTPAELDVNNGSLEQSISDGTAGRDQGATGETAVGTGDSVVLGPG